MTTPIKAQSLSSLAQLLANPPQYPRNPTHATHDPLVLYIVRVPGSKDVFLTPLKPPAKSSISLDAVQSCLYYLHVDTPEDEILRKSLEEQRRCEEAERAANTVSVARKPLPSTPFANYPASQRPPTPPKSYPHYQPRSHEPAGNTQRAKQAARGSHLRLSTSNENDNPGVKRKPVGPRPFHSKLQVENIDAVRRKPVSSSSSVDRDDWRTASTAEFVSRNSISTPPGVSPEQPNDCFPTSAPELKESMSITLIRRDPSSSSQWNIGHITLPLTNKDISGKPVKVELSTPGYQKFRKNFPPPDFGRESPSSAEDIKRLLNSDCFESPRSAGSTADSSRFFTRWVAIQNRHNPAQGNRRRSNSDDIVDALRQGLSNSQRQKQRPRFEFTSPWQGACIFGTGVDGRSLKCRHILPVMSSTEEDQSLSIAELRFNLPWLVLKSKDMNTPASGQDGATGSNAAPRASHVSFTRGMQHLKHLSWNPEQMKSNGNLRSTLTTVPRRSHDLHRSVEDQDKLDLSLAQERAGGGFKGKSAKLGKLVIEDEGLKMCDLVVAACMGIWWQQYLASGGEA